MLYASALSQRSHVVQSLFSRCQASQPFRSLPRVGLQGTARFQSTASWSSFNAARSTRYARIPTSIGWKAAGVAGVGIGLTALTRPAVHCEQLPPDTASAADHKQELPPPPPPQSSVNMLELSFGTVCGICAGVFIKKGAKAVAFVLGGVFVLLQYLGSLSLVRVDWARMGSRFENLFYTKDVATGAKRPPTVYSLWRWIVDFLTADFQQRASFVAGLALGFRVG